MTMDRTTTGVLLLASCAVAQTPPNATPLTILAQERVHQVEGGLVRGDHLWLSEAALKEMPGLTKGLLFIKVISVVAPLMGLLGTVTGMIKTFQVITLYGAGDPKMMAGGISQALMTTVLGLVVAIPMVLLHTVVSGQSRKIINILQSQSAGLVAQHSEKNA